MAFEKTIERVERSFAWGFVGTLIGILGIAFTLFYEKKASIRFDVLSETSVVSVNEKIGDLAVTYQGVDVTESKQVLKVLTLRVLNDGSQDIVIPSYDPSAPLGIKLEGRLIRAELLSASNDYLKNTVRIFQSPPTLVTFKPVILDRGEWYLLKVLLFADEGRTPIAPIGKIAGITEVRVSHIIDERQEPGFASFLAKAFGGTTVVQVARFLGYTIGTVAILLLFAFIGTTIGEYFEKRKRIRVSTLYLQTRKPETFTVDRYLVELFKSSGEDGILSVGEMLNDQRDLNRAMKNSKRLARYNRSDGDRVLIHNRGFEPMAIKHWAENGWVKQVEGRAEIDPTFKAAYTDLRAFLSKHYPMKRRFYRAVEYVGVG